MNFFIVDDTSSTFTDSQISILNREFLKLYNSDAFSYLDDVDRKREIAKTVIKLLY